MTTTLSDLVESTRRYVSGTHRAEYNFLTSTIAAGATSLTFDLPANGITRNTIISIDDELMFVKSVAGQVATVARAWLGSTAASHTAAAVIEVSPRFTRFSIKKALQDEILSWPPSLYYLTTITISGVSTTQAYDLTSIGSYYNVTDVQRAPYTTETADTWKRVRNFHVQTNLPTATFPSGSALFLGEDLAFSTDLQVTVAKPFDVTTSWADSTVLETACNVPGSMLDIPPMGAAWRLLAPLEVLRTYTEAQGESRNAAEVPSGSTLQAAAGLKRLRDIRIVEEGDRLASQVPLRW